MLAWTYKQMDRQTRQITPYNILMDLMLIFLLLAFDIKLILLFIFLCLQVEAINTTHCTKHVFGHHLLAHSRVGCTIIITFIHNDILHRKCFTNLYAKNQTAVAIKTAFVFYSFSFHEKQ